MSEIPPVICSPPSGRSRPRVLHHVMAHASWAAPFLAYGINRLIYLLQGSKAIGETVFQTVFCFLIVIAGIISGAWVLFAFGRIGGPRIFVPALGGIALVFTITLITLTPVLEHGAYFRAKLAPVVHLQGATILSDQDLRFCVDIPAEFRRQPLLQDYGNMKYLFVSGFPTNQEEAFAISIESYLGMLPKYKRPSQSPLALPPGENLELRNWRGLKIDAFRTVASKHVPPLVVYEMQIPIYPNAIGVSVLGPEGKSNEVSRLVDGLLNSLDGKSSW